MYQRVLELVLFEDHAVCSGAIPDSLVLERVVYERRALMQSLREVPQLDNRQNGAQSLFDLVVKNAFPARTNEFALEILDMTHVWSNRDSGINDSDDLHALAGAVHRHTKLHISPQQR